MIEEDREKLIEDIAVDLFVQHMFRRGIQAWQSMDLWGRGNEGLHKDWVLMAEDALIEIEERFNLIPKGD